MPKLPFQQLHKEDPEPEIKEHGDNQQIRQGLHGLQEPLHQDANALVLLEQPQRPEHAQDADRPRPLEGAVPRRSDGDPGVQQPRHDREEVDPIPGDPEVGVGEGRRHLRGPLADAVRAHAHHHLECEHGHKDLVQDGEDHPHDPSLLDVRTLDRQRQAGDHDQRQDDGVEGRRGGDVYPQVLRHLEVRLSLGPRLHGLVAGLDHRSGCRQLHCSSQNSGLDSDSGLRQVLRAARSRTGCSAARRRTGCMRHLDIEAARTADRRLLVPWRTSRLHGCQRVWRRSSR
mmetsp:Transcript_33749/g.101915  ORF Transcript_33749/g.101915 Transcript_33749/m.101915 type:complete len:286 (-) Transcript_33749:267-1124(-)